MEVQSLDHWATRGVPHECFLASYYSPAEMGHTVPVVNVLGTEIPHSGCFQSILPKLSFTVPAYRQGGGQANVIFFKCNFLFLVSRNAIDLFIAELATSK